MFRLHDARTVIVGTGAAGVVGVAALFRGAVVGAVGSTPFSLFVDALLVASGVGVLTTMLGRWVDLPVRDTRPAAGAALGGLAAIVALAGRTIATVADGGPVGRTDAVLVWTGVLALLTFVGVGAGRYGDRPGRIGR